MNYYSVSIFRLLQRILIRNISCMNHNNHKKQDVDVLNGFVNNKYLVIIRKAKTSVEEIIKNNFWIKQIYRKQRNNQTLWMF